MNSQPQSNAKKVPKNPSSLKSVPDKDYLEASGMNNIYENLLTSYIKVRPDDSMAFLLQHFERVKNCHHVLGCELNSLKNTRHNRMSFIHYFQEFFKGFSDEDVLSVVEFQHLMDLICVNISKKIVQESAMFLAPSSQQAVKDVTGGITIKKYPLVSLKDSLFFNILFEDWLLAVEHVFRVHCTLGAIDIGSLRWTLATGIDRNIAPFGSDPPDEILGALFDELSDKNIKEISYEDFRRGLCGITSPVMHDYVNRVIYHALPISSGATVTSGVGAPTTTPQMTSSSSWGAISAGGGTGVSNASQDNSGSASPTPRAARARDHNS